LESALKVQIDGNSIADAVIAGTATIGEKINLRRVVIMTKTDTESFGSYIHLGGKISSLIKVAGGNDEFRQQICMHVAATKALFLNKEQIDDATLNTEREILVKEALNEGKPEAIAEKMVAGRMRKYLENVCLVEQEYVFDDKIKIKDLSSQNDAEIIEFVRFEVGEGIEKKEDNFAEEVMAQVNK